MNITNCVSQFHIWRVQVIHVKSFLANGERKGTLVMLPYSKHEFNVFRKTIAILADSQHSEEWKQTLREHEEKKDRVIEKYKTKCEQKRVRTLTVIIENILLNSLSNHQFSLLTEVPAGYPIKGTLRSHDGDGNENFRKAIGLISKTRILHVHHAFLYISLPALHDCDVKLPKFTFYGESKQTTTKFSLFF